MYCPKCGQEQFCPCKHCRKAHENKVVWEWKGDVIACGKCGVLKAASWWEGLAFDIYCDSVIDCRTYPDKCRGFYP
uniref:Uncharacterized protein n=1 Tax=viral metagenome TaxID=1070528 RepID=A0A6M3K2B6_9ZZZZ